MRNKRTRGDRVQLFGRPLAGRKSALQVDADASAAGGAVPDVRVPLTEETVYAMLVKERDLVLETAIAALDKTE